MTKILKMDERLANMIAAGEVVERPSSIVKELVENAIDADANVIRIEIFDVGMTKIQVTDNGSGMNLEDALLAFERHATSKIKTEYDLSRIHTLGFRGEALAAIQAVAKVTLKTKTETDDGVQVIYHGGHFINHEKATLNRGTIVIVEDLFYNTPARFKYIKSEQAEKNQIIDIFDRLALANPAVRFQLWIDGKLTKETFGQNDFQQLIDQIYGTSFAKDLITFKERMQNIDIEGYLVSPKISRTRKKDISLFVNQRYIRNYRLTQAVIDGYHSFLMVNKYPIAVIHLTIDPQLLDVNVHPQKLEIKLMNESLLAFQIEQEIKRALEQKTHAIPERFQDIYHPKEEQYVVQQFLFESEAESPETSPKIPDLEFIGIFSGTYLLFQNEKGLYFIDQHAAEERIRYEYYYEKLGQPQKSQRHLLIPYHPELTKMDWLIIHKHEEQLKEYQFAFKNEQLVGCPVWLRETEIDIALQDIVEQLSETNTVDLAKLRDALAKDISCKSSIRANHRISPLEIQQLVKDLRACKNPYTCPHGRPTIIKLSHYDVERMFKRVVS